MTLAPNHTANHGTTNSNDSGRRQTQLRGKLAAQISTIQNTLEQDMAYTIGTLLSDATAEKYWRKLLHRGLNVRNRHPKNTTEHRKCRRGCGQEESMLHTVTCDVGTPYWDDVFGFIEKVLQEGKPKSRT